MKDREVCECAPEYQLATRGIKRNANDQANCGYQRVEPRTSANFIGIKIDAKAGAPNMRHIDQQYGGNPRPFRRAIVQDPRLCADPQREESGDCASEKYAKVDWRGEKPTPGRGRVLKG